MKVDLSTYIEKNIIQTQILYKFMSYKLMCYIYYCYDIFKEQYNYVTTICKKFETLCNFKYCN